MSNEWVPLDVADVDPSPFVQFTRWFDEASGLMAEREAVALATADLEGRPSVRMVLLRLHDGVRFGWYTNYESRKALDLASTPHAALLWHCATLGRQIRIEGDVEKASAAASDAYFATRARGSQLGAHASHQSHPVERRSDIEQRVAELEIVYRGVEVPRPENWGGYVLTPRRFEFWQHRDDRLHDRVIYQLLAGTWRTERQSP